MIIDGISLMAIIFGALVVVHSMLTDSKNKNALCVKCGKEDLFPMLLFKAKTLRLCKKCYDEEIDQELAVCTEPLA